MTTPPNPTPNLSQGPARAVEYNRVEADLNLAMVNSGVLDEVRVGVGWMGIGWGTLRWYVSF